MAAQVAAAAATTTTLFNAHVAAPLGPFACGVRAAAATHRSTQAIIDLFIHPFHTYYDILGVNSWSPQRIINANAAALTALFAVGPVGLVVQNVAGCTCLGHLTLARNILNNAQGIIGIRSVRAVYDNAAAPAGMLAPCPVILMGTPLPYNIVPRTRNEVTEFVAAPTVFDLIIPRGDVDGTNMTFVKIVGNPNMPGCRKRQNSFWWSLSMCLDRVPNFWAWLKASTWDFWDEATRRFMLAMGQNPHARGDLYFNLDQTCQIRGVVGSIEEQLLEDRTGRPLAGPRARMPLRFLTPETWQVVADTFNIELIIFCEIHVGSGQRKMNVYVRGNHNARQIFMFWKNDGSYVAIEPLTVSPSVWRYTKHMDGMTKLGRDPDNEVRGASSVYKSPLLSLAPGGRPLSPRAGIINSIPGQGYVPFTSPFTVPEPFASMPSRFVTNNFHNRYLNTGQWC